MKQVTKEKVSTYTAYLAADGTEFTNEHECLKYEDTAKCSLFAKYKPLVINSVSEDELFGVGNEDCLVDLVKISNSYGIATIMQLYRLYTSSHYQVDDVRYTQLEDKLVKYSQEDDIVIIGRGYENDAFWVIGSLNDTIATIKKFANE